MAQGRGDAGRGRSAESGSTAAEYLGLVFFVALLFALLVTFMMREGQLERGRDLGSLIGRRMACAPLAPGPCSQDPLKTAYGEALARLVRYLAPSPAELTAAGLAPVDFRYCRRPSCAVPAGDARGLRVTRSNRRLTAFTELRDLRRSEGRIEVFYWLYRPGQPWQALTRVAGATELAASRSIQLGGDESPRLVPLETLPGRNHYRFRRGEEPPWRWRITPVYPGRPA